MDDVTRDDMRRIVRGIVSAEQYERSEPLVTIQPHDGVNGSPVILVEAMDVDAFGSDSGSILVRNLIPGYSSDLHLAVDKTDPGYNPSDPSTWVYTEQPYGLYANVPLLVPGTEDEVLIGALLPGADKKVSVGDRFIGVHIGVTDDDDALQTVMLIRQPKPVVIPDYGQDPDTSPIISIPASGTYILITETDELSAGDYVFNCDAGACLSLDKTSAGSVIATAKLVNSSTVTDLTSERNIIRGDTWAAGATIEGDIPINTVATVGEGDKVAIMLKLTYGGGVVFVSGPTNTYFAASVIFHQQLGGSALDG